MKRFDIGDNLYQLLVFAAICILIIVVTICSSCKKEESHSSTKTYCVECDYSGNLTDINNCGLTLDQANKLVNDAYSLANTNHQSVNCNKHEQ